MPKITVRHDLLTPCATPDQLHRWATIYARANIPRTPVCPHHHAPFDYLCRAYFEPASDLIVWAPRGGGKTRLGAIATLLDLLHKPGCQVRILGGSLEQSLRMWEHLYPNLLDIASHLILGRPRSRRLDLQSGSAAAVLTQSQRAIRGLRVQKLRCDEVELFDPKVWTAAQLTTRSHTPALASSIKNPKSKIKNDRPVAGAIEAISTLHTPFGLMHHILDQAEHAHRPILRWCLLEVLEHCPPDRDCPSCPLHDDCHGLAKTRCEGFVKIPDAIAMKQRVSQETWKAEMLCRRPSLRQAVFPTFDNETHVTEDPSLATDHWQLATPSDLSLSIDFGFASPFVCLWLRRWDDGHVHVIDEYVQPARPMHEHIEQIRRRPWGGIGRVTCDPAGQSRNDQTAASDVMLLKQAGYAVKCRSSAIVDGLEMIRAALRPAAGKPKLFIHPRCQRLIRAMRSYRYAEGGSELPVKDGEHDHLIDALRYHFVNAQTSLKAAWRRY